MRSSINARGASVSDSDAANRSAMGSGRPDRPKSQSALIPSPRAQSAASWAFGIRVPACNSAEMVERSTPVSRARSACVTLRLAIASARRARNTGARSRLSIFSIICPFCRTTARFSLQYPEFRTGTAFANVTQKLQETETALQSSPRAVEWPLSLIHISEPTRPY